MQETVSDKPHVTDNHTEDGLFTTTTATTTTTTTSITTLTTTSFHSNLHNSDFDEGTLHLVVIVCSLIVFVGLLCSIKSIVTFVRSLQRRQQGSNISGNIRPGSSFFRWFTDDPPPYPGKYSRTNVNYLPSYESAIKIANQSDQTTVSDVTIGVAETEPVRGLPEVSSDSSVIMFSAPENMNTLSEPTQSSEFENSNENIVDAHSNVVNLGNETCSASNMNES